MNDDIKLAAVNLGLDPNWIQDFITKFGEKALGVVIEALRSGWNKDTVMEIVQKLGVVFLQLIVDTINSLRMKQMAMGETPMDPNQLMEAGFIDVILEKWLPIIIDKYGKELLEKYLPVLVEKYAPLIIDYLVELIKKALQPDGPPAPDPVVPGPVIS